MPAPITLLYAGLAGLFMAALSIRVPIRRGQLDVPWGDGDDVKLATRIRVFGNFIEYVPTLLLLLLLLELSGVGATLLHGLGVAMLLVRGVHAVALTARVPLSSGRKAGRGLGAMGTWLVLVVAALAAVGRASGFLGS